MRMMIFLDHKQLIARHNERYYKGEVKYKMGLNQFSDMRHEELFTGLDVNMNEFPNETLDDEILTTHVPSSWDWREKGAVTPVKNQGHCGSCWIFGATGAMEAANFLKIGTLVSLSEQQVMDCIDMDSDPCQGGWPTNAFNYVKETGGIESDEDYPYEEDKQDCRYDASKKAGTVSKVHQLRLDGDENKLRNLVATKMPITVAVHVNSNFQHYEGEGIYADDGEGCYGRMNHAVLVVGYGTKDGQDYWIVKNSWSSGWGADGYIYMARNLDNLCSIANLAMYAEA